MKRVIKINYNCSSDERVSSILEEIVHWLSQSDFLINGVEVIYTGSEGTVPFPLRLIRGDK